MEKQSTVTHFIADNVWDGFCGHDKMCPYKDANLLRCRFITGVTTVWLKNQSWLIVNRQIKLKLLKTRYLYWKLTNLRKIISL